MTRTFGTAELKKGTWHISAEPHVAIRLRRMFKKAGKQVGTVKLAHTDEIAKDLLWFTQRYPLEVKPREALEEGARCFDERAESFDALLAGRIQPREFEMALPPREYQRVAAELALQSPGLLIADDMGVGKTCSAIAMLTDPSTRPALVVTMTHLTRQWEREIMKFAPTLRTHRVKKGTPYDIFKKRQARRPNNRQIALLLEHNRDAEFPDVLIMNYHKLAGWSEALAGKVKTVIFDEVQELRRGNESLKGSAARHIAHACNRRVGLSGTPIYNYGIEFFNVMDVLRPGALGTKTEFVEEWCGGGADRPEKTPIANPRAFGTYVREAGFMIRRTRKDVGRELPPCSTSVVWVDSDDRTLEKMSGNAADLARIILEQGAAWDKKGQASREFDMRMRQATGIAKAPHVADFVKMIADGGEKVVLYGWHREVYSIWLERLKSLKPALYTGTESEKRKEDNKRAFVEGDAQVLIMSLRTGAGIDGLQEVCRNVVFGELDWSSGVHKQATDRVNRDGQQDSVMAYYVVTDDGSDPVVMDVLGIKGEQLEGIRNPKADFIEKLGTDQDRIKKLAETYLSRHKVATAAPREHREAAL